MAPSGTKKTQVSGSNHRDPVSEGRGTARYPHRPVSGDLVVRKVTVVVGVFPGERGLFLHAQVSQKVHLKEEKTLIPMVPLFGTFFYRNLSGKVAESHETGKWGRDRGGEAWCTGRCYRRHGKDRPRSPRICNEISAFSTAKERAFHGLPIGTSPHTTHQ